MKRNAALQLIRDVARTQVGMLPRKAFLASVQLNTVCNLRCSYCFIADGSNFPTGYTEPGLPFDQMRAVLWNLSKITHRVIFTGGEPFLYRQFKDLLSECRHLQFQSVGVITNGMFLEKERATLRLLDSISVSYDMARYRQYPKELDEVCASVARLRRDGTLVDGQLSVNYTMCEADSPEDWEPVFDFLAENGLRAYVQPERDARGGLESWEPFNRFVAAVIARYGHDILINPSNYLGHYSNDIAKRLCEPKARLYVDINGNLAYPCESFGTSSIGSLQDPTFNFETAWQRAADKQRFPSDSCDGCAYNCVFEPAMMYTSLPSLASAVYRRLTSALRSSH